MDCASAALNTGDRSIFGVRTAESRGTRAVPGCSSNHFRPRYSSALSLPDQHEGGPVIGVRALLFERELSVAQGRCPADSVA